MEAPTGPRWDLRLDGSLHAVQLRPGLRMSVMVDGTAFRLPLRWGTSPRSAAFPVGAHEGIIRLWAEYPPWRTRLRRALGGSLRGLPWYLLGGAVGAGASAAAASSSLTMRTIFELTVDGRSHGAWVSIYENDTARWSFELVPRNPWRNLDEPSS